MDISLRPETRKLLEERLSAGKFGSADDLVVAALKAYDEIESLDESALDAIDQAEEHIERRETQDWRDVRQQVQSKFLGK